MCLQRRFFVFLKERCSSRFWWNLPRLPDESRVRGADRSERIAQSRVAVVENLLVELLVRRDAEGVVDAFATRSRMPNVKIHRGGGDDGREARWSRMPRCNGRITRLGLHLGEQDEREHFQ